MPIQSWIFKSQDSSVRHIGPVAQDFHRSFGFGTDNRHISSIDADGIALAAIQGLYKVVNDKDALIDKQKERIDDLEARLHAIEAAILRD